MRLYDEDAYCRLFSAVTAECRAEGDHYRIRLDRTAFYPEGGGQPGDTGCLKRQNASEGEERTPLPGGMPEQERIVRVKDTIEENGLVWHITDKPLPEGTVIQGEIDWDARFDRMQNHTGEHIVSGLIHSTFGYNNVGFHMGSDYLTIDIDGLLTMEQLEEIEYRANEMVWKDTEVVTECLTEEEAAERTFRSKKELHGIVRLVTIPDADVCACCGTHVARTGQIGLIRIVSCVHFRSGCRIEMLCGKRAYEYDSRIVGQNRIIMVELSAPALETAQAVKRMKESLGEMTFRCIGMEQKLFDAYAKTYAGEQNILLFTEPMTPDSVRKLAVAFMEAGNGACAVFSGTDDDGYKYAAGQTGADLRALVKEMNTTLSGRGGGKPFFAQGSIQAKEESVRTFFEAQKDGWTFIRL